MAFLHELTDVAATGSALACMKSSFSHWLLQSTSMLPSMCKRRIPLFPHLWMPMAECVDTELLRTQLVLHGAAWGKQRLCHLSSEIGGKVWCLQMFCRWGTGMILIPHMSLPWRKAQERELCFILSKFWFVEEALHHNWTCCNTFLLTLPGGSILVDVWEAKVGVSGSGCGAVLKRLNPAVGAALWSSVSFSGWT